MMDSWFVVPAVTDADDTTGAKYADTSGVTGYSGNTVEAANINSSLGGLLNSNPGVATWYIVRFYGSQTAINSIAGNPDTRRLSSSPDKVESILNNRVGASRGKADWNGIFRVD